MKYVKNIKRQQILSVYLQLKDKMSDLEYKDQLVEWLNDDEKLFIRPNFVLFYTKTIIFENKSHIFITFYMFCF